MAGNGVRALLVCALMCAAGLSSAQSVGDLAKLQADTIMLKAQAARQKAEADLRGNQSGVGAAGFSQAGTDPVLLGIFGGEASLYARFALEGGAVVEAREGDSIFGGYRVAKLAPNDIVLTKHGKRWQIRLPGAADTAAAPRATAVQTSAQAPALPSLPAAAAASNP